jgi:hypothetical protein
MSRGAGWTFLFRPCPDQLASGLPIETLTQQSATSTPRCVYLALLFVSGGTALHLTPLQPRQF